MFSAALYAHVRTLLPIAHETAGAARIRHSLRPLTIEGEEISGKPRAIGAARMRNCILRHCERSEAIHAYFLAARWIASLRSQ